MNSRKDALTHIMQSKAKHIMKGCSIEYLVCLRFFLLEWVKEVEGEMLKYKAR